MHRSSIRRDNSKFKAFLVGFGTLVTGAINAVIIKEQDIVKDGAKEFFHPYLQTFFMFFAEFLMLIVFYALITWSMDFRNEFVIRREEARRLGISVKSNTFVPIFPALVDLVGSIFQFISIFLLDPSIYIMLRGGVPIPTAIFSVLFGKGRLFSHHKLGLSIIFFGIVSICLSVLLELDQDYPILGLLCVLASLFTTGVQYVIEEKLLQKYFLHPLKLVGLEGLWGIILTGALLVGLSMIPCNIENKFCNWGHLENVPKTFEQVFNNTHLMIVVTIAVVNSSFFNLLGISVSKYVSPMIRISISVLASSSVWIYSFLRLNHKFSFLQFAGWGLIVLGNLIHQEIMEIPGLNANTRKNQEKRALFNESLAIEEDDDV